MLILKQSTARNIMLKVFLASDHVTAATGKTLTVTASKDGGAFAAIGGTVTEVSSGWYKVALTTTDTNTLGTLIIRATAAACDDAEHAPIEVVAVDMQDAAGLGLSRIDAAITTLSTLTQAEAQTAVANELDAAGAELSAVPTTSGTLREKLNWLFQYFRNRRTVTASTETIYKENASTSLGTASISDNGTTFDKGEMN
jgi:hypothetical protein